MVDQAERSRSVSLGQDGRQAGAGRVAAQRQAETKSGTGECYAKIQPEHFT